MTEINKSDSTKLDQVKTGEQPRKRVPLGTRNILTAPKKPGFVRRFVNDKGDRVQAFKDAGYSIVEEKIQVGDAKIGKADQLGSDVRSHVGGGQTAVLMEIPEEYYIADKKAAQDKITQTENEIRRKENSQNADGLSGQISIS